MSLKTYIHKYSFELICLIPLIVFIFLFTILPIAQTILLSLQDAQTGTVTIDHYQELCMHDSFRTALSNTLVIAILSLTLEVLLGLGLALFVTRHTNMMHLIRPLFILPLAIPTVVVGVMMSYLFSTSGWINQIALDIGLIKTPIYWTADGWRSLMMIIIADCWKVTPLVMLILIAGLNSIDQTLYEAAKIDGASAWYTFKRITLPLLMPALTTAIIIRGIDAFRIFALPLILMGENLKVIGTYSYLEYAEYHNVHLSAASSVILLGMILLAVAVYIRLVGKRGIEAT